VRWIHMLFFIFCLHHFYHSEHLVFPSRRSCRSGRCRRNRSPPRWPVRERLDRRAGRPRVRTGASRRLRFTRTQRTPRWSAPPLPSRTQRDQPRPLSPLRPLRPDPRVQSRLPSHASSPGSRTRSIISSRPHRPYLPRTRCR